MKKLVKKMSNFLTWVQSPAASKYAGVIVATCLCLAFVAVAGMIKLTSVKADAVGMVNGTEINEVRMASVDYVFEYQNITFEEKDSLRMYVYQLIDPVKLLHMVNMRQHVVFTSDVTEITLSEEGNVLYVPVNAQADDMWAAIAEME